MASTDRMKKPLGCTGALQMSQSALTFPDMLLTSRLAFGMVSHTNEKKTTYYLEIVMWHCREIFEINKFHKVDI